MKSAIRVCILLLVMSMIVFPIFSQNSYGTSMEWETANYLLIAGTNRTLTDKELDWLIIKNHRDIWLKYRNDEFEWHDRRTQLVNEINKTIDSYRRKQADTYYTILATKFGEYDFDREGFKVDVTDTTIASVRQTAARNEYTSPVYCDTLPYYIQVMFKDFGLYSLWKMPKDEAREFLAKRRSRSGDINRDIRLVIQYTVEQFDSDIYNDIKSMYMFDSDTELVVGNITKITVFDSEGKYIGAIEKQN